MGSILGQRLGMRVRENKVTGERVELTWIGIGLGERGNENRIRGD